VAQTSDIQAEQAYLDRAYDRLEAMRATAESLRDSVIAEGRGGTHQNREEREIMVRQSLERLERLKIGRESLCFGRIDRHDGDRYYIGRLPVSDERHEPLIVDWRAPVAEPFYRATGRHRMGLVRRRHFITKGPRIVGIEDEVFDLDAADDRGLVGEGALLAALERSRTGRMHDIVATIQGEQDEIIRAPMQGVLVVQGGPGTGKTAVALHRAAYLLYTHRFPLETQGVLVVGPNPLFLRYIEHVLPSLGETGVTLSTISGLVPGIAVKGHDGPLAARVKGDVRMAKVVAKAVRDRQRPLRRDAVVPFGAYALRISAGASADIVRTVQRRPGTHNVRRRQVEQLLVRHLHRAYLGGLDRARRSGVRSEVTTNEVDEGDFVEVVRAEPAFRDAVDRMWPLLLPEELLHDLFGAPPLLGLAAPDLPAAERDALARPRSRALEDIPWTAADVALLDEAAVHLGPRRQLRNDEEAIRSFGHIVVDEAQDLSPMQLRMLARRSLSGSMTVVGDIGQATGYWAPNDWSQVLAHLPSRKPSRQVELTVNYRTPAEIMEVAAGVLRATAPHLSVPQSVRRTHHRPSARLAAPNELVDAVVATARDERSLLGEGIVAVIAPDSLVGALDDAFGISDADLDAEITVVPITTVKGLEFDGVVVVEPELIAGETPQGLRALYVALTRATQRLVVVHSRPLPASLRLGLDRSAEGPGAPPTLGDGSGAGSDAREATGSVARSGFHC
jgi:DNA helicase IV